MAVPSHLPLLLWEGCPRNKGEKRRDKVWRTKDKVYFLKRSFLLRSPSSLGMRFSVDSPAFFSPSFCLYSLAFLLSSPEEEKKISQGQKLQFKAHWVKSRIYWFKSAYFWDSLQSSFTQAVSILRAYANTASHTAWCGDMSRLLGRPHL